MIELKHKGGKKCFFYFRLWAFAFKDVEKLPKEKLKVYN